MASISAAGTSVLTFSVLKILNLFIYVFSNLIWILPCCFYYYYFLYLLKIHKKRVLTADFKLSLFVIIADDCWFETANSDK